MLANRLSENPSWKVLLIDAGPEKGPLVTSLYNNKSTQIPAMCIEAQLSDVDWQYKTVPQKHCDNRIFNWPRGKLFGGCSAINAMLYVRGNKEDYDNWEKLYGCEGWNFNSVLPYFKKSENCMIKKANSKFHGSGGPLNVQTTTNSNPNILVHKFVQGCAEIGIPSNEDINGESQVGATISPVLF